MMLIGVAPITQVSHMRNKNSNIQGRSLNVIKRDFPFYKELLIKESIRSPWEQILSFKRSFHFKRDAIEENHCLYPVVSISCAYF